MADVATDIKDQLVSQGIGTFGATSGWGIYISFEPDAKDTTDTTITIYETSGDDPNPKWLLDYPHIQIRVRGAPGGYQAARSKCQDIQDALLGLPKTTINGTAYVGVWMVGQIMYLTQDDSKRPIFVMNFRVVSEPSSGTHRTAL